MTTHTSPQSLSCDACGAPVAWAVTEAGARYLADLSREYANGVRYSRGAHRDTCDARQAARDAQCAAEAAHKATERRMVAFGRWSALYREEIRAWAAVDPEAASAHIDAALERAHRG